MSKPTYRSAKIYLNILEIISILILIIGLIMSIDTFQNNSQIAGLGAAATSILIFLAINAFAQMGLATIHTAENTRRMADMMEADMKARGRVNGSVPDVDAAAADKLVARR